MSRVRSPKVINYMIINIEHRNDHQQIVQLKYCFKNKFQRKIESEIIIILANILIIIPFICVTYLLLDIFHTADKLVYDQFVSLLLFRSKLSIRFLLVLDFVTGVLQGIAVIQLILNCNITFILKSNLIIYKFTVCFNEVLVISHFYL